MGPMSVAVPSQLSKMRIVSVSNPATAVCRTSCRMVGGWSCLLQFGISFKMWES